MTSELIFPIRSAFLALPLENEAKWEFQRLQELTREYEDILNFQNPQSPHLTLQYWPEVMQIEFNPIIEQSKKIASVNEPFTLKIEGIDTFGTRGDDHVLFLSVPFSEELARLKKRCPWPSALSYHPHVTLAYIKHPQRFAVAKKKIMKLLNDASFTMKVDHLRLYAEVNRVKQTPLEDFEFSSIPSPSSKGGRGTDKTVTPT